MSLEIVAKYRSTQMTVHRRFVIPAKAGIQAVLMDSGQKIAGMTPIGNGHSILWSCTKIFSSM
jgi:hypothetical protein